MSCIFQKPNQGFTLIEVLIALVVSSLLLALLSGVFYSVSSRWEKNAVTAKDGFDQAKRLYLLQRSIAGMVPWYERDNTYRKEPRLLFQGNETTVQWVTSSPVFFQGEANGRLEVLREKGGYLLRYSESPLHRSGGGQKNDKLATAFDVFSGADGFVLSYWGAADLQTRLAGSAVFSGTGGALYDHEGAVVSQNNSPPRNRKGQSLSMKSLSAKSSSVKQWFSEYDGKETRLLPEKIAVSVQGLDKEYFFTVINNSLKHVGIFDEGA